jgi:Uma2 family endonuclease
MPSDRRILSQVFHMNVTVSQQKDFHGDVPTVPIWRFTLDEYHEMVRAGILHSGAPIEFLEGWLVTKMIKNPAHRVATRKTRLVLEHVVGERWSVDTQEAITTHDSEPEPDISVVRGDTTKLADRHPRPDEIGLLVEVADSTLSQDRGPKKRVYAAARIPVYWIVNLIDRCVEVYTMPTGPGPQPDYEVHRIFGPGELIPLVLDAEDVARLAVDDLLP